MKRTPTGLISLFLVVLPMFLLGQSSNIDSLKTLLNESGQDSSKAFALKSISSYYLNNDPVKAFDYGQQLITLGKEADQILWVANGYYYSGYSRLHTGQLSEAIILFDQASQFSPDTSNLSVSINLGIAQVYWKLSDLEKALDYCLKSLEIIEERKDSSSLASVYNNIGILYEMQKQYGQAEKYYNKAKKIFIQNNNIKGLSAIENNLGIIYLIKKEYELAYEAFQRALSINRKNGFKPAEARNLYNIANIKVLSNVNQEPKQYQEAVSNYSKALEISRSVNDLSEISRIRLGRARAYLLNKNYEEAKKDIEFGLKLALELKDKELEKSAYGSLAKLDSTQGNYLSAIKWYQKRDILEDSLFSIEKNQAIAELQTKFEVGQKEKENQALTEQAELNKKALENSRTIQQQQKFLLVAFAFIALGAIVLALVLYQYNRTRKLANEELTQLTHRISNQKAALESQASELQQANKEVHQMNENLEKIVEDRTRQMQRQNLQLIEYAYFNAHKVRGPLARIMGLVYLLQADHKGINKSEILDKLDFSAKELDEAIKEIDSILHDDDLYK